MDAQTGQDLGQLVSRMSDTDKEELRTFINQESQRAEIQKRAYSRPHFPSTYFFGYQNSRRLTRRRRDARVDKNVLEDVRPRIGARRQVG